MQRVVIADPQGERLAKWAKLASHNQALNIIVPVRPVAAIVA